MNNTIEKTQITRLVDILLLAPFMIYFGLRAKSVSPLAKGTMVIAGIGTAIYNGINFVRQEQEELLLVAPEEVI